jgi:hypothetical protein
MLIDAFVDNGYPLSVGIIGEAFDPAATSGWDKTITNYMNSSKIQKAIKSGLLQVVSHSYSHPESSSGEPGMSGMSPAEVTEDLNRCSKIIHDTGMIGAENQPATFTVPLNAYGEALTSGARSAGIRAFTAQCSVNPGGTIDFCGGPGAQDIKAPDAMKGPNGVYHMAAGAVLEADGFNFRSYNDRADFDAALAWSKRQAERQGFVVFMMHPQEFATKPSPSQCNPPGPDGVDK